MIPAEIVMWSAVLAGVLGLAIGSFLNVVIYRVPIGLSIVSPPSACLSCAAPIQAIDNLPVLSWLMLRGRCRHCAVAISRQYPLIELITGAFFASVTAWYLQQHSVQIGLGAGRSMLASGLGLVALLYLAAVSVALAAIDIKLHRLPNRIVLPSYIVGIVLLVNSSLLSVDFAAILRMMIGLAVLWGGYYVLAFSVPGGMGFGDVKLAGLLGLFLGWLGWGSLAVGAFAAFLLGGLFALGLVIARRANRKSGIPFGPWMLAGAWLGVALGDSALAGYLAFIGLPAA